VILLHRAKFDSTSELVILLKHQRHPLIFSQCFKQQKSSSNMISETANQQ